MKLDECPQKNKKTNKKMKVVHRLVNSYAFLERIYSFEIVLAFN